MPRPSDPPLWARSYDHWATEMGRASARHGVTVAYGPETHDAWRSGLSPDDYARRLAATQPRRAPASAVRDDRTPVDIAWYVVPNRDVRRGGYMPVYEIDGGRRRGDEWGRGHDRATAEALALEAAQEEAARYIGDYRVTVRRKMEGPEGAAPRAPSIPTPGEIEDDVSRIAGSSRRRRRGE